MSQAEQRSDETWVDIADSHWRRIAEQIPHIVWMASPDGQVEFLNQQARDYLRWPPEGWLERHLEAVHPDDAARVRRAWLHAVDTQTEYSVEFRIRHADGEYLWHCVRGLPICGAEGEVTHWIGTATDIDKHKQSEAALREIGDQLNEAQHLAKVGNWYADVVTGTHQWSDEMYRLLGYEPGQVPPDPERLLERAHPADGDTMRAVTLPQTSQLRAREAELRIVLPDIGLRWLAIRSEPVVGASGEVVAVQGTAQNVTERKLTEEHLRFQAHLLDAVGEAVIATDLAGTIIYWGPGAEELYGWKAPDVLSRSIVDVIPAVPAPDPDAVAEIMARLSRGEPYTGNMVLGRQDGSTFVAQVTDTPVLDDSGRLVGIIGISSDVTAREEAHAQLERAQRSTGEALMLLATFQAEAPVGLGFVDRDFRYVRLNHELASIIGEPAEELVGRKVPDVVAPDLWGWLEPVLRHVLTTGEASATNP